ncbi:MAG: maleylpyruvate isomerase N-terminal domain-containing protein [Rhodothermales bacterium]|nr:maleylpyruvate isomerase N-terminal domain-containing protein [Rhodothermales bacterium]
MSLLRSLGEEQWTARTLAGEWQVRDVAAHLLDGQVRRLSLQRDQLRLEADTRGGDSYEDLVQFLNRLNHMWVDAFRRVSPTLLIGMLDQIGPQLAKFYESLDPMAPAFFPVAWAGQQESLCWMDVGRDYTELWHHQAQIRDAVGAPPLLSQEWLTPLLELSVHAIPVSLSGAPATAGTTVTFTVLGDTGGSWTATAAGRTWALEAGRPDSPSAEVRLSPDDAWRLFYNALPMDTALERAEVHGDPDLARRLLGARSVMVSRRSTP